MSPETAARRSPEYDRAADAYRRRVWVRTVAPGRVVADLEDDFHRFEITLEHDGTRVQSCTAGSERWPWVTCPDAAGPLGALAGMPLARRFTAAGAWTEPRHNCTHQFDAACHAITHAAWGREERVYDVEVPTRARGTGTTRLRVWVDGVLRVEWRVTFDGIEEAAAPYDAAPWRGGFMRWADATLPEEEAECAIVARRCADIALGRGMDLDGIPIATLLPPSMEGVCHTMQPGIVEHAVRHVGSIRDFAAHPEHLHARPFRPPPPGPPG